MRRNLMGALFVVAAWAGVAMAGQLPMQATVAVVDDAGTLVGTGLVHDGIMEIALGDAAGGFVTLQLTAANGRVTTFQALVPTDGSLEVVMADGVIPARVLAARNALAFELRSRGTVEAQSAPPTPYGWEGTFD